jgi:hypothetical protein
MSYRLITKTQNETTRTFVTRQDAEFILAAAKKDLPKLGQVIAITSTMAIEGV